jgi:hypothetical protein
MSEQENYGIEFIGPFEEWRVTNGGYRVPFLSAIPQTGPKDGMILLSLDRRYLIEGTADEVRKWIPFICNAMAIAAGFSYFGPDAKPYTPFGKLSKMMGITSVETEQGPED